MAEWAKEPELTNTPIRILVVPEPDDDGRIAVRAETLEELLKAAGYFLVQGKIHV